MPFFISAGHVAEASLKQVMTFEFYQSAIEYPFAARQHLDHRTFQIVVGQLARDSAQILEEMVVGIQKAWHVVFGVCTYEGRLAERKPCAEEKE